MPHVERNIEIEASVENVFKIIDDSSIGVKWLKEFREYDKKQVLVSP